MLAGLLCDMCALSRIAKFLKAFSCFSGGWEKGQTSAAHSPASRLTQNIQRDGGRKWLEDDMMTYKHLLLLVIIIIIIMRGTYCLASFWGIFPKSELLPGVTTRAISLLITEAQFSSNFAFCLDFSPHSSNTGHHWTRHYYMQAF